MVVVEVLGSLDIYHRTRWQVIVNSVVALGSLDVYGVAIILQHALHDRLGIGSVVVFVIFCFVLWNLKPSRAGSRPLIRVGVAEG